MGKGISLHIGLNSVDPQRYEGWSGPLNACEADANDMADLAQAGSFSFTKLLTRQATREAVLSQESQIGRHLLSDLFGTWRAGARSKQRGAGRDGRDVVSV